MVAWDTLQPLTTVFVQAAATTGAVLDCSSIFSGSAVGAGLNQLEVSAAVAAISSVFGFRLVETLECSVKKHFTLISPQPYFSMTYFHLLLPIPLQIARFVQGTAVDVPPPSGSSNQLEVSTAVAGFTWAATLCWTELMHSSTKLFS